MNYLVYLTWGSSPLFFETLEEAQELQQQLLNAVKDQTTVKLMKVVEL
jgi:hypothetical protein